MNPWRLLLLLGCLGTAFVACGRRVPVGAAAGQRAPDFVLPDLAGNRIALRRLHGRFVFLDFWATWCAPCRVALQHLQAVRDAHGGHVEVLALTTDGRAAGDAATIAQRLDLTFPVLVGPDVDAVAQAYGGVQAYPTTLLLDRYGVVVARWTGARSRQEYEAELAAAMAR